MFWRPGRGGRYYRKKYRQPIYRNFSNYRQIIDIEFWEFGNYRKIIDIENCIQFYPINTIESIVLKTRKGPQRSTEKLLVARDFWCSKANTDSVMVLDIKSVVRSTTCEHVKQKCVVAVWDCELYALPGLPTPRIVYKFVKRRRRRRRERIVYVGYIVPHMGHLREHAERACTDPACCPCWPS